MGEFYIGEVAHVPNFGETLSEPSHTATNNRNPQARPIAKWLLVGLVLVFALLYFTQLGSPGLWDFDEGFYAQISREMVERSDYGLPVFNGDIRFDKPPLTYWTTALFYQLFGYNEVAVRFTAVLHSLGTIVITAMLGMALLGTTGGLLAGAIVGSGLLFSILGRMGMMDTPLAFYITAALVAVWFFEVKTERRKWWPLGIAGLATGLAIMTKGPAALMMVGLPLLFFLGPVGFFRTLVSPGGAAGALALLLVAAPWHIVMTLREGASFWTRYFGIHQASLYTTQFMEHGGPWYYHIVVMVFGLLPWTAILPWLSLPSISQRDRRFLLAWLLPILVFFSAAATKAPAYTLPIFPAAAIWLAAAWQRYAARNNRTILGRVFTPSAILSLLAAVLFWGLVRARELAPTTYHGVVQMLIWLPVALLVVSLTGVVVGACMRKRTAHLACAGGAALVLFITLSWKVMPALDHFKPQKALVPQATALATPGERIGTLIGRGGDASTRFYAGRPIVFLNSPESAAQFVLASDRPFLLLLKDDLPALQKFVPHIKAIAEAGNGALVRAQ